MCRTDRGWEAVGTVAALVIQKVAGRAETGMALNPPMRSEAGRERETQPSAALDESSRLRALGPAMRNTPEPTPVTIRARVISHPVALGRGGDTVGRVLEKVRTDAQHGGEFRVGPRAGGGIARDAENGKTGRGGIVSERLPLPNHTGTFNFQPMTLRQSSYANDIQYCTGSAVRGFWPHRQN